MPAAHASTELTNRIDQLLKQREEHASAIAKIDDTLMRVGSALGGSGSAPASNTAGVPAPGAKRRGRPPGSKNGQRSTPAAKPGRRSRRTRGSFELSGEQSVMKYIEGNKNASTKDVNQHWKGEGRGGSADNTLSKLVREKKVKRSNIEGQRGSTYVIA